MRILSNPYVLGLILVILTLAVFWQVFGCGFVYDDEVYVVRNPHVQQGFTGDGIKWAFTAAYEATWQPLTWLSYMLDHRLYGLNPAGFHLTNLVLHIVNVLLLFIFLNRATGAAWQSGFVAALFAVHPLRVESVAWVAERKDVLSTLFWLLTMLAYLRYVKRPGVRTYAPILLLFALGLAAKPMLVTLPFVLLLLDYWPLGRYPEFKVQSSKFKVGAPATNTQHPTLNTRGRNTSTRLVVLEKLPLFVVAGASGVVTFIVQQKGGAVKLDMFPLGVRVANALVAYVAYILKMLWPKNLAVLYPHLGTGIPEWQVYGSAALLVLITVLVLRAGRPRPYLAVGWLWYLGTLVPVIGLVQIGEHAMADRFTYVPLIGLFIIIAWGLPELLGKSVAQRNTHTPTLPYSHTLILSIGACAVIVAFAVAAFIQVRYWKDGVTLFRRAAEVTENNTIAYYNLGVLMDKQGRLGEAVTYYSRAAEINPYNAQIHCNLASALIKMGDLEGAIGHYREAVDLKPDFAEAHFNLAVAYASQGRVDDAIEEYRYAIRLQPGNAKAHNNLAVVLYFKGKYAEAWEEVHMSEDLGLEVQPGFREALSKAMAEPLAPTLLLRGQGS